MELVERNLVQLYTAFVFFSLMEQNIISRNVLEREWREWNKVTFILVWEINKETK